MLARNAESLYWIGRYVERADDTARILDVTVHQLLEDSSVDPDQASRTLLQVLGIEPPEQQLDLWSLTDLVAFSRDTHGGCSIVESISAARENARGAREVTSTEIWECLNTTYNALAERERAAKRLGPARVPVFRRRPRGDVRRAGGLDTVPRRRLPVHVVGPRTRTGGHDRAAASVPGR